MFDVVARSIDAAERVFDVVARNDAGVDLIDNVVVKVEKLNVEG
jgi:hypothetical protein